MQEAKAAWEEVGSVFSSLGLKLKEHFAEAASNDADGTAPSGPTRPRERRCETRYASSAPRLTTRSGSIRRGKIGYYRGPAQSRSVGDARLPVDVLGRQRRSADTRSVERPAIRSRPSRSLAVQKFGRTEVSCGKSHSPVARNW